MKAKESGDKESTAYKMGNLLHTTLLISTKYLATSFFVRSSNDWNFRHFNHLWVLWYLKQIPFSRWQKINVFTCPISPTVWHWWVVKASGYMTVPLTPAAAEFYLSINLGLSKAMWLRVRRISCRISQLHAIFVRVRGVLQLSQMRGHSNGVVNDIKLGINLS